MGIFSKNWSKELDRAEDLLARDLPVPALEIAERAERRAEPDLVARAASLTTRARQAVLSSVLAKADAAEAVGDLEDAADWLLSAIEQETSSIRRSELEARRQGLLDRGLDVVAPRVSVPDEVTVGIGEPEIEPDSDFRYETLVAMLGDPVREHYEGRPADFRQAVVDLNEGRVSEALEAFELLAREQPDDPVLHLELGRTRLVAGDPATARADFSRAWDALGDEPLDAAGVVLVPALWAEASLAAGCAGDVVDRLETLASPQSGRVELCRLFAAALIAEERAPEAVAYLETVAALIPADSELSLLKAQALAVSGDPARAIAALEHAIAPSCAAGCAAPAPHLPSFRLLASLHLEPGGDAERARELMARVANARHGHLGAEDHEILARYYDATGDTEAATAAAAEAARLAEGERGSGSELVANVSPTQRRVL